MWQSGPRDHGRPADHAGRGLKRFGACAFSTGRKTSPRRSCGARIETSTWPQAALTGVLVSPRRACGARIETARLLCRAPYDRYRRPADHAGRGLKLPSNSESQLRPDRRPADHRGARIETLMQVGTDARTTRRRPADHAGRGLKHSYILFTPRPRIRVAPQSMRGAD